MKHYQLSTYSPQVLNGIIAGESEVFAVSIGQQKIIPQIAGEYERLLSFTKLPYVGVSGFESMAFGFIQNPTRNMIFEQQKIEMSVYPFMSGNFFMVNPKYLYGKTLDLNLRSISIGLMELSRRLSGEDLYPSPWFSVDIPFSMGKMGYVKSDALPYNNVDVLNADLEYLSKNGFTVNEYQSNDLHKSVSRMLVQRKEKNG